MASIVTIHLLCGHDDDAERADALSALLTEFGGQDETVLDWTYARINGRYDYGRPYDMPADYEEGEFLRENSQVWLEEKREELDQDRQMGR